MNLPRLVLSCLLLSQLGCHSSPRAQNTVGRNKEIPPATAQEIQLLQRILADRPNDPAALFNLALDEATIGERDNAIELLQRMAEAHTGMDPREPAGRPFKDFSSDPRFVALVAQIEKENPPIIRSKPAITIHERDLAPEGIAYDPVQKVFYLSSLSKQKIVRVSPQGEVADFKTTRQDGLGLTLGMKVDSKRRILWVVSIDHEPDAKRNPSGVFQYDLKTGALRFKHQLPPGGQGFLNDVALTSSGEAFASNSGTGEIFRMSPDREGLEQFLPAGSIPQANGIAVSTDDKLIFVAGWIGVVRVDLATKQFGLLTKPSNVSDAGLDGMCLYKGSIIGIQNPDLHPARVMRYSLNPKMDTITRQEVLEAYNPLFDVPTTAAIVRDSLYFVANTQLEKRNQQGAMPPVEQLHDIELVKLKL
jgi:sugar lactone lactonase YvrE